MSVVFHDIAAVAKRIFELMSTQDVRDGSGGCSLLTLGTNVIITTSVDLEHELMIFLWGVLVTMRVAHYAYLSQGRAVCVRT